MSPRCRLSIVIIFAALSVGSQAAASGSFEFVVNETGSKNQDYGRLRELPEAFGNGDFTLELWVRPNDRFPVGPVDAGEDQLTNWAEDDNAPYTSDDWWRRGNFLLDGNNNDDGAAFGTFSLQFYAGGRVRWLFGDGSDSIPTGDVWAVGANSSDSPSLLDGQWHQLTLVRRSFGSGSILELWIDGDLIDSEFSNAQTDMEEEYWEDWDGFDRDGEGWFFGAEKRAASGELDQHEDYKGFIDELRFWSRAKSWFQISAGYDDAVTGSESGLVGWFDFSEGRRDEACDVLDSSRCIKLKNTDSDAWSTSNAPIRGSGVDIAAPSTPSDLSAEPVSNTEIDLSWSPSSDDVAVTGYTVRRDGEIVGTPSGTSFRDSNLDPNTTYSYTVDAFDAAGNTSPQSAAVQVTTPASADTTAPTTPVALAASPASGSRIELDWAAASDDVAVTGYTVRRDGDVIATTSETRYSDSGLTPNTTYSYTVDAFDAAGNTSPQSDAAEATTSAVPDTTPPSVPSSLTASAPSGTQIDLNWAASGDSVGVAGYTVRRDGEIVDTTVDNQYSDLGLVPNTTYTYTVDAFDAAGNASVESAMAQATTQAVAAAPPDFRNGGGGAIAAWWLIVAGALAVARSRTRRRAA